jgi:hypothetical protein
MSSRENEAANKNNEWKNKNSEREEYRMGRTPDGWVQAQDVASGATGVSFRPEDRVG